MGMGKRREGKGLMGGNGFKILRGGFVGNVLLKVHRYNR